MKTSIFSVLSLLGVLTEDIDPDHRSLLRGSTSTSSTSSTDSAAFQRGLQDLTKQCPKPAPVEFCTKEVSKDLVPVRCDDCTYDNICVAGTAGFLENDCEQVDQEVEPVDPNVIPNFSVTSECPERNPDVVCRDVFAPVVCDDCVYENGCVASGAGYAADDCEPQEEPADPVATPIDSSEPCPETGLVSCNRIYDPVICNDVCSYGNLCLGVGAGFFESDCLPNAR
jgi:hypothetical protein